MSENTNTLVQFSPQTRQREYFKWDKYLGGAIKIRRSLHTEDLGHDLFIHVPESSTLDNVFVNGRLYVASPTEEE